MYILIILYYLFITSHELAVSCCSDSSDDAIRRVKNCRDNGTPFNKPKKKGIRKQEKDNYTRLSKPYLTNLA